MTEGQYTLAWWFAWLPWGLSFFFQDGRGYLLLVIAIAIWMTALIHWVREYRAAKRRLEEVKARCAETEQRLVRTIERFWEYEKRKQELARNMEVN